VLITGVGNDDDWGIISLCGNIKFWLMKEFYSDDELVWIPLIDKNGFFPIGVAYRPNEKYSQNILELIELLRTL